METVQTTSALHAAAQRVGFPSKQVCGFTLFAPASAQALVEVGGSAPGILVALNAEKLGRADLRLRGIANAHVAYPDGAGAVLALARKGVRAPRLAGTELWLRLVERYAGQRRFYLVGSTREVVARTAAQLTEQYPSLDVAYRDGFLSPGDADRLCDELVRFDPGVVLVAMGSPRQEILMDRLFQAHPALYMGLGGSFDVYVGMKPRAPRWMQSAGLEWAYQFVRNPRRLPRLPAYLKFAWLLAMGRI